MIPYEAIPRVWSIFQSPCLVMIQILIPTVVIFSVFLL